MKVLNISFSNRSKIIMFFFVTSIKKLLFNFNVKLRIIFISIYLYQLAAPPNENRDSFIPCPLKGMFTKIERGYIFTAKNKRI